MIQHKMKCNNSICKCLTINLYPKISNLQSEDTPRSIWSRRSRIEMYDSEAYVLKNAENTEEKEENTEDDDLLIYRLIKDIMMEQLLNESSCYIYIYKAYIEKYYLSEKFQALTSISYANEKDPSLYEQFLIFCFRYIFIYGRI